jgi:hypothetical protein
MPCRCPAIVNLANLSEVVEVALYIRTKPKKLIVDISSSVCNIKHILYYFYCKMK